MYEKKIPKRFDCGFSVLMEIIGGKWKSYMIYLINEGKRRPSELQRAMPDASRRVLDLQLRELELHGIVQRKIYAEVPPKVEYYLTDFGRTLLPIIDSMEDWGSRYLKRFEKMIQKKSEQLVS